MHSNYERNIWKYKHAPQTKLSMKSIIIKCNKTAKSKSIIYKMGFEGGLWRSDSRRSSFTPSSRSLDRAISLRVNWSGYLFLVLASKSSTKLEASSASLIHASFTRLCRDISSLSLCYSLQLIILKKTRNWERNNNHKKRSQTNIDSLRKYKMRQLTTKPRDLTTKPFLIQLSLYFLSGHLSIYLHFWNDCFCLILKCACGDITLK